MLNKDFLSFLFILKLKKKKKKIEKEKSKLVLEDFFAFDNCIINRKQINR